jgi:hypothetical protein
MPNENKVTRRGFFKRALVAGATLSVLGALILSVTFAEGYAKEGGPQRPVVSAENKGGATPCLQCHGPFDRLASIQPRLVAPSGEKINPHVYVPHDSKEVPDCLACHKAHSANPNSAELAALPTPTVKSCFACHHKENFQNCKGCHE